MDEKLSVGHFCDVCILSCRKNLITQHPLKYTNYFYKEFKIVHISIYLGFTPGFPLLILKYIGCLKVHHSIFHILPPVVRDIL